MKGLVVEFENGEFRDMSDVPEKSVIKELVHDDRLVKTLHIPETAVKGARIEDNHPALPEEPLSVLMASKQLI